MYYIVLSLNKYFQIYYQEHIMGKTWFWLSLSLIMVILTSMWEQTAHDIILITIVTTVLAIKTDYSVSVYQTLITLNPNPLCLHVSIYVHRRLVSDICTNISLFKMKHRSAFNFTSKLVCRIFFVTIYGRKKGSTFLWFDEHTTWFISMIIAVVQKKKHHVFEAVAMAVLPVRCKIFS